MRNFSNKFDWIWTLDAKVIGLQIRLPNYVKTLFIPLGDEGLGLGVKYHDNRRHKCIKENKEEDITVPIMMIFKPKIFLELYP